MTGFIDPSIRAARAKEQRNRHSKRDTAMSHRSPAPATLLPCPFCGVTNAELEFGPEHRHWPAVRCNECGTLGPSIKLDHGEATDMWNTRVPDGAATPTDLAIQNMLEPRRSEQEHRRYLDASRRADTYRKERDAWKLAAEAEAEIGKTLRDQLEAALAQCGDAAQPSLGKEIAKLMDKHGITPAKPQFWLELEALTSPMSSTEGK